MVEDRKKKVYYSLETDDLWVVNCEKTFNYGYYAVTWYDIMFWHESDFEQFVFIGEF